MILTIKQTGTAHKVDYRGFNGDVLKFKDLPQNIDIVITKCGLAVNEKNTRKQRKRDHICKRCCNKQTKQNSNKRKTS